MSVCWGRIALCAALIVLGVGSVLYVPPAAVNLRKPVPGNAQIIYSSENPDIEALRRLFSFDLSGIQEPGLAELIETLESGPLSVATVSLGGRTRRNTVVVTGAIGAKSVALRWKLGLFAPDGVSPAQPSFAWPVWKVEHPDFPEWMRVRFAVADGLLIGSISDNSHDIYYLLDVLDGRRPSIMSKERSK